MFEKTMMMAAIGFPEGNEYYGEMSFENGI
jgi:hypothetical protein